MSIRIDVKDNIIEAYQAFDNLKRSEIHKAARRAINRTLVTVRKEAVGIIKEDIRIKSSVLKAKYIWIQKPTQKNFGDMRGDVVFSSKGIALVEFIRGSKSVTSQKGLKIKNRKKVRVEVTPGKRVVVQGAFLQKTSSKGLQILKRDSKTLGHTLMQSAPSVGALLLSPRRETGKKITTVASATFQKNFQYELNYRMTRLIEKAKTSQLK